jgi:ketosteroid isomerase-like protein
MDKSKAVETIKQFINLILTDVEAASELISEDFVWENFLPKHMPFGGRYEGMSGLKTYLGQLAEYWTVGGMDFVEFIFDSETKVTVGHIIEKDGRSLITGRSCDLDAMWEFRFTDDNKLKYVREYNDTSLIGGTFDS